MTFFGYFFFCCTSPRRGETFLLLLKFHIFSRSEKSWGARKIVTPTTTTNKEDCINQQERIDRRMPKCNEHGQREQEGPMERICCYPGHVDQPTASLEDSTQPRWKIPGKEREQGVDGEWSCIGRRHRQSQRTWKNLPSIF